VKHFFFLLSVSALVILLRINCLNLPFFWDEAWSYAPAVMDMHNHGAAIMPGHANAELTRGHPLLFYFLAAEWAGVFGNGLVSMHAFPLLISLATLWILYFVALNLLGLSTARIATVMFAAQSFFLVQSTLLLPEMMLTLWTLLTMYAYFKKKWVMFVLASGLLVMTKETGLVLIGVLFIDTLFLESYFAGRQQKPWVFPLKELVYLFIPVLFFALFLVLQKIHSGWFLFREHADLININPGKILDKFWAILSKLLFMQGRGIFFFLSLFAVIRLIIKKSLPVPIARQLLFFSLLIIGYILFSSMFFFTPRYLLSLMPILLIPGSWLMLTFLKRKTIQLAISGMLLLLFSFHTFLARKKETDTTLGFRNSVLVQKEAVHFADSLNWQDKKIYSRFLMLYYMRDADLGYLKKGAAVFKGMNGNPDAHQDLYIFFSCENDPCRSIIISKPGIVPVKKFERKGAWVEIYNSIP
jgi:4-amino-4-deoxy-L-arabinose transferase-like glycosyltransferase